MKKETKIAELLIKKGLTLSVAESCTGGLLTNKLTDIPGSSSYLKCGLVTYSNEAKVKLLKIPEKVLSEHGAVSCDTALAMSGQARKLFKTDFGVGISGIAGPTGGTKTKPVGLVYISVSSKHDSLCLKCLFKGTREQIKQQAADQALMLLEEFI